MQDRVAVGQTGVVMSAATGSVPGYAKRLAQAGIFFALMPYLGVAVLPSDTQPVAFVIATVGVGLLLAGSRLRLAYLTLPLLVMALLATVSLILRSGFDDVGYIWLARSYYGYASAPVLVTFFLYYLRVLRREEIARVIDVALAVVFIGFLLNALGLSWIIQGLVNRAVFPGYVAGARGLASFFAEPSNISEQMAMCFFCYVLTGQVTKTRVAAIVAAMVISAAGQMFVIVAHVVLAYGLASGLLVFVRKGLPVSTVTRFTLAGVLVAGFISFNQVIAADLIRVGFPTRGITAISRIIEEGRTYIGRDVGIMNKVAAPLQVPATLRDNPFVFKLAASVDPRFRETIGRTYPRLLRVLFDSDKMLFQTRPSTALGLWVIEFGVLGLLVALSFMGLLLWHALRASWERQLAVLWASLFLIQVLFIKIQLANPSLWLLSALIWTTASEGSGLSRQSSATEP